MFAETILDFADYLNEAGYAITPDKATQCIESFSDEDVDCTVSDDVIGSMRFYFCKDRMQRQDLPEHFMRFLRMKEQMAGAKDRQKKINEAEEIIDQQEKKHQEKLDELSEQIHSLEDQIEEIKEKVSREWQPDPANFSNQDLKFLQEKKKWIDSLDMPDVENILSGKGVSVEDSNKAQKKVMNMTAEALTSGDLNKMSDLDRLFKILQKTKTAKKKEAPKREKAIKEATRSAVEKIESLKEKRRREKQEHQRLQQELNRRIADLRKGAVIMKPEAIHHREEFLDAKNAVQMSGTISCPKEAEKTFKKLTEQDKRLIYQYICENILKFKTRMTRNILELNRGNIDMATTIRNACRTGGLPMDIFKELRRPGKSNLILILDVSGSCKEASEMMITFMYLLREVFPRGCRAYAFVNSLYDITNIMEAGNAEDAIRETLDIIPRSGQYSNYNIPIRDMWENRRSVITKDSLVVMIGDARNNKNDSAENAFKNITRRAKKTYWLNTDTITKWGQGDSIAPTYAKYCKMYEVRTPKAIVQFLDQGMK